MVFIESPVFTRLVQELLADDEYAALQAYLTEHPDAGDVMQGLGGLRKLRWAASGRGKRGGARVIYFHAAAASQVRMVLIYPKNAQADLSAEDRKRIRKMMENWT